MANKRILSFLVACSMVVSMVMPTTSVLAADNSDASDAIIEESLEDDSKNSEADNLQNGETTTVTILGTTDLHGRFLSYDYATGKEADGGLDKVATVVKQEREVDENLLLVDNGDAVQGNYNHLFVGEQNPMVTAFNEIGYDSFSFGNHEFNQGLGEIQNFMTNGNTSSKLNFLCANLYKDGKRVYSPYVIKESNGVKVAIIGVVAPNIVNWDSVNLKGYNSTNPAKEVGKVIEEIKANEGGADLYFVTAHVGLENEYGNGDSAIDVAEENPEVSGVIAGHSHTLVTSKAVNNAVISQPKNNGDYVSKFVFTLEKDGDSYNVVDKTATTISCADVKGDESLKEKLSYYHNKALEDANSTIGTLDADLAETNEVNGIPQSAVEDQGITDFINKVQLYYSENALKELDDYDSKAYHVSGAALLDSESNLKAGNITKANIASIYKYDNKLYTIKTTGKQLKKYLEWTAKFYNTYNEGDLTVSFNENIRFYNYDMLDGVKYDINISKDAGNRIENLVFENDNKEVSDEDIVYLTVNDYRYNSVLTDELDEGQHEKILDSNNDEISDVRDMIADYIENVENGKITREVDNNWQLTGITWNEKQRNLAVEAINSGKLNLPTSQDGRTPNIKSVTWNDVKKALGITDDETTEGENTSKVIDILSITDLHGNILENGKNIGAAKLAAEVKRLKEENENTMILSGGDLYQGTAISNLLYGEPVFKIIKEMGIKYSAVGNHEFDWGIDKIEEWSKYVEFLAANIYDKNTGEQVTWAKPYAVEEIDGVKIGFIGLATPETAYKTSIANVKDLEFKDPVDTANTYAKYLKEEEGVDFVIALTHLGGEQDENGVITGEVSDLANGCSLLDGIISGHTHNYIEGTVNNVPIVQALNNGRALANLQITINENGESTITPSVDKLYERVDTLAVDETVKQIVSEYEEELKPILSEVVATVNIELPHDRSYNGVTVLGQFMTKYMAEVSDVQIALTNSGGLRTSIDEGDITVGEMWDVLPFDNTLVTMNLKGSDLKRVIEHGIMNNNVGWIQYYGLNIYYDSSKEYGDRITSMRLLDGTKIEMDKYYSVVTNDFMAAGGDNYDFTGATDIVDTQEPVRDALMVKFREIGNISFKFDENTLIDGQDPAISDDDNNGCEDSDKPCVDEEEDKNTEDSSNGNTSDNEANKDENNNINNEDNNNSQGKDEDSTTVGGSTNENGTTTKPNSGLGNLPHTGAPTLAGMVALIGVGFIVAGKKMNKDDENNAS